ncbi:MAG: DNA polymerase III subunits gamma and tau [uncultured Acidimicrobiales bacterium]|uniref:DNA polymerase III subunit gamma/tau n=1 Tax=uncultured Acidimicrobiales bacterium TaxID=310071 RepID=A0A6J4HFW6_9ACTN|nr:MAG: DNA polymerase III subunits gamma and tau [uncultured Acidimicrobiales bacterium]
MAEPTSLYRRFRPQRFAEMRGQEFVVSALRNAVRDGRVAHAYLFSGPRGTGKTTTARILAKALNCTNRSADGDCCDRCASCTAIRDGGSLNVVELDAASNRGIDRVREIIAGTVIGSPGEKKVYIFDEVHQLTSEAGTALLKTLEEPPEHVVFVLATTDPEKVAVPVVSRTQHFKFRLYDTEVLTSLVHDVVVSAGIELDDRALAAVVRDGRGSARDTLSVLEQVASAGGLRDDVPVADDLVEALIARDAGAVLVAVAAGMRAGRDPRRLGAELVERLRLCFLSVLAPDLVDCLADERERIADQAKRLGPAAATRAIEVVGEALVELRESVDPRVTLEVALVRVARADLDTAPSALVERIERLERAGPVEPGPPQTSPGGSAPPAPAVAGPQPAPAEPVARPGEGATGPGAVRRTLGALKGTAGRPPAASPSQPPAQASAAPGPPASPVRPGGEPAAAPRPAGGARVPQEPAAPLPAASADGASGSVAAALLPSAGEVAAAWEAVLADVKPAVRSRFGSAQVVAVDTAVVVAVDNVYLQADCEARRRDVETALANRFGRPVPVRITVGTGTTATPRRAAPPAEEEHVDLTQLVDAPPATLDPHERLRQAFPGAEEVL